jgi:hypothetical protein
MAAEDGARAAPTFAEQKAISGRRRARRRRTALFQTFVRHVELSDTGGQSLDRPVLLSSRVGGRRSKPKIPAIGGRR